jgi:hypothetical protein
MISVNDIRGHRRHQAFDALEWLCGGDGLD